MPSIGLIPRIALLVVLVELVSFSVLVWYYTDRFSHSADQRLRDGLQQVVRMIESEEISISAVARQNLMGDLLGAPYIDGLVIGGNRRVIVSHDPRHLGRQVSELPTYDNRWFQTNELRQGIFVADQDRLTWVQPFKHHADGSPLYTIVLTISTVEIQAEKQAIFRWGLAVSTLFILLSSACLVLVAQRIVARRVEASLRMLEQVAHGQLDARIDVLSNDELGQLQHGINAMTQKLGLLLQQQVQDAKQQQAHKELLQSVLEHAPFRVFWKDRDLRYQGCNSLFAADAGYTQPHELTGRHEDELHWRHELNQELAQEQNLLAAGVPLLEHEINLTLANGQKMVANVSKVPLRNAQQEVVGLLGLYSDITARKQTESELRLYASIFSYSAEAQLICDPERRILAVNRAFTQLTGYTLEDVRGKNPGILSSGQNTPDTYKAMWADLNHSDHWQGEIVDRRKDGSVYPKWLSISVVRDSEGNLTHYVGGFMDISERKKAENHIAYLAHHDTLTGLQNRYSLLNKLEQALATARRAGRMLAVMFIDLDRFKTINDTLGHACGDALLQQVADRLRANVRDSDIVARFGGDEFVVVLSDVEDAAATSRVANKLLEILRVPYLISPHELHSSPSIGIALFPSDGNEPDILMKNADVAMYHAKREGRNNTQFFTAALNESTAERLELERELRLAIDNGLLQLHYQPQICAADGKVHGVEALVRWAHPTLGAVSPAKFIPIAEESGLILPLGSWVLDTACRQAARWKAEGIEGLTVAVNLSAHQLRQPELIEQVQTILCRYALHGSDLELEITESVAMEDPQYAIKQLQALRGLDVQLSIDDFGTGYSSLAYLKLLPIQTLKLDRAFVRDIETDPNDAAISTATLALAHSLGLQVVAEGVENEAQRSFLAAHGCDRLQGYLFSRPEPAEVLSQRWKQEAIAVKTGV
ncbi:MULTISPECIES: EAL domain-containing protein [Giesbergeria]|uniref:EAL domain-containing protein n=1 Tax=Giesbergeria sinuosa TaxID=80883 RepID=A0ABV9QH21_9BURK